MRNGLVGFALGGVLLVVAGCGGGSGTTGSTAAPASTATAESSAPAGGGAGTEPSAEASVAAAASEAPAAGGVGGTAGNVCELVTADELEGILGVPVALDVLVGPPDTCDVQSTDGAPLAAFVLTDLGAAASTAVFEAYASSPGAQDISGIGEKAAYDPNAALLVVLKGGAVFSLAVFDDGSTAEAARVEVMKRIATIAAGRM